MKFEKATSADAENILALYRSLVGTELCAWTEDYPSEREVEYDLSRESLFCLKEENGDIVGSISIDMDEAVEGLPCWTKKLLPGGELSRLGVSVSYQNQGVARQLLLYGMEELKKRGMKSVHFLVNKYNEKAIRSYGKLDFNIVGEAQLFDQDFWCYEKELK